jgi:galactose oxidase
MNGNAVMYDIGKILKVGGAPAYEEADANANAYIIDISSGTALVKKVASMNYARAMHNSVVLPNGQVIISGGQTYVKIFSDDRSVLMTELWDPKSEAFINLRALSIPRNYHSFSLLLPDGRVLIGGGGLCSFNCTTNHLDAQILTPPYLLNADGSAAVRPTITSAPGQASYGSNIQVRTGGAVSAFALVRLSAVTHSLNNDQRRVPVTFSATSATSYTVQMPTNSGIAPPGYYMLFALNANGVPSVSTTLQLR